MLLLVLKRQFLLKHITFLTIFTVATIQKDWQTWELEISAARTTRELTRCLFSLVNVGFGLGGDHCYTHQSLHISNFRLFPSAATCASSSAYGQQLKVEFSSSYCCFLPAATSIPPPCGATAPPPAAL